MDLFDLMILTKPGMMFPYMMYQMTKPLFAQMPIMAMMMPGGSRLSGLIMEDFGMIPYPMGRLMTAMGNGGGLFGGGGSNNMLLMLALMGGIGGLTPPAPTPTQTQPGISNPGMSSQLNPWAGGAYRADTNPPATGTNILPWIGPAAGMLSSLMPLLLLGGGKLFGGGGGRRRYRARRRTRVIRVYRRGRR